jgi:hypothetical protein
MNIKKIKNNVVHNYVQKSISVFVQNLIQFNHLGCLYPLRSHQE